MTRGVLAAARGELADALAPLALVWSNGLMLYLVAAAIMGVNGVLSHRQTLQQHANTLSVKPLTCTNGFVIARSEVRHRDILGVTKGA